MFKKSYHYQIFTELREESDGQWSVFDRMVFESGRASEIRRYLGTQQEAEQKFEMISQYWKTQLEKKPNA